MIITATFLGCVVCVKAYQAWGKAQRGCGASAGDLGRPPSVGLNGMLVEPRK